MADDNRDFIERTESRTTKLHGKPASLDQIADNFALYGLRKRAATLEDFDTELRAEIDSGSHSLRRRVVYLANHEEQRDRAVRRAQNEAAIARQKLRVSERPQTATIEGARINDFKGNEIDVPHDARRPDPANPRRNQCDYRREGGRCR